MPVKGSISTQDFSSIVIPVLDGLYPPKTFTLRKNATAQMAESLEVGTTLTIKVKGIEPNVTVFPQNNQVLIWGIGPRTMLELSTLGTVINAKFPWRYRDTVPDYTGPWSWASISGLLERNISITDNFDLITKDTEITYTITPYTTVEPTDWGFTVTETIPGRTPQETTTDLVQLPEGLNTAPAMRDVDVFPMKFYIGWVPLQIPDAEGPVPLAGYIGNPVYTLPNTPGYNHGLIYTHLSVE